MQKSRSRGKLWWGHPPPRNLAGGCNGCCAVMAALAAQLCKTVSSPTCWDHKILLRWHFAVIRTLLTFSWRRKRNSCWVSLLPLVLRFFMIEGFFSIQKSNFYLQRESSSSRFKDTLLLAILTNSDMYWSMIMQMRLGTIMIDNSRQNALLTRVILL